MHPKADADGSDVEEGEFSKEVEEDTLGKDPEKSSPFDSARPSSSDSLEAPSIQRSGSDAPDKLGSEITPESDPEALTVDGSGGAAAGTQASSVSRIARLRQKASNLVPWRA